MISPGFHFFVSRNMCGVRHLLTISLVPERRDTMPDTMPIVGAAVLVIVILLVIFV
jgi:hypothetical protein